MKRKQCISVHAFWLQQLNTILCPEHTLTHTDISLYFWSLCCCYFLVCFYFVFVTDITNEQSSNQSSSRCISHFCLRIVFTKLERNSSYTQLDFRGYLGLVLSLNDWQISPMGTAKGNLQSTELKHSQSSWTHPSIY